MGGYHLSTRSYDVMYRVREGKSKLEPFYRLIRELFLPYFLAPGLITCLNRVWTIAMYTEVIERLSSAEVVFVSS